MRVLQIIDSLKWGGAQKMQIFLAESLVPLGIQVGVLGLCGAEGSDVPTQLIEKGAEVHVIDFPRLFSPAAFMRLERFIRRGRYDLIHAHLSNANILGVLGGQIAGVPVIASLRSSGLDMRYQHKRRVWVENTVVRYGAARVMANGWEVGRFAKERYAPREVDIIPNAIDLIPICKDNECFQTRIEMVGAPDRPTLLSVGRLTHIKGFGYLLEAFAEVHRSHPSAALAIAGQGKLHNALTTKIDELGLKGHVFLLGLRNDVYRLLAACDLYINSSTMEGLPVSVLEAMAAGLPVIATSVGDTSHVVTPETGIVVEPAKPEQLAAAMQELLDNPDKRSQMGRAAQERIASEFSRANWVRQLLQLYARVTPAAAPFLASVSKG